MNHGEQKEVNSKMRVIEKDSGPTLCLFAVRDLFPGEEILYDYGIKHLPWKKQRSVQTVIKKHAKTFM